MGFRHINMDLIAALPGESDGRLRPQPATRPMNLHPESITVHTLAIKRSSRLH